MPDEADLARVAREALARAKADALAKGNRPARPQVRGPERDGAPDPAASRSAGRRPRRDDPQPLNAAIGGLIDARGWREAAAVGSVFGRWAEIVGPELAEHTRPESLTDGELTVTADSTAWATEVTAPRRRVSCTGSIAEARRPRSVQRVQVRGRESGPESGAPRGIRRAVLARPPWPPGAEKPMMTCG